VLGKKGLHRVALMPYHVDYIFAPKRTLGTYFEAMRRCLPSNFAHALVSIAKYDGPTDANIPQNGYSRGEYF